MPILVCGINHKTAPLALREKVVFPVEKLPLYLADLLTHENIREAVILSTCNRSEIICDSENENQIRNWFCQQHSLEPQALESAMYFYSDAEAIEHIMQVACGLDSMVLGETQILGQLKEAFSESCAAGAVGSSFNRLFQQVFSVAKEVRTNTTIGACPVSVASAAVGLAKQIAPDFAKASALIVGAGDTGELVLRHLKAHGIQRLAIANRNRENANTLAENYGAATFSFDDLQNALAQADIVISATGSAHPIINKTLLQKALAQCDNKSIVLIDIAVPRDIEPSVTELPGVTLYCIDDLKNIIQHNLRGREHAAEKAREVIQQKTQEFVSWLQSFDMIATTISVYRGKIEEICHAELVKAARQLQRGEDPHQVLASFAHAFTNKLLHSPSVQLRQAGSEGRFDILQLAQQLFAIPQPETELL
jgi:glutamyl-tRNA reductase